MERRELLQRAAVLSAGAAAAGTGVSVFDPGLVAHAARASKPLSQMKFSVIVKTVASDYWSIVIAAAKHAAKDLGVQGLQYTGGPSEADIAAEVNLIENNTTKNPDFLVIAPTDKTGLNASISAAYKKGIKIILIDSDAPAAPRQVFMATNNFVAGGKCADALAAAIKAKTGSASGQIAYITFQSNVGSLSERDAGFLAGIKKYPGLKVVAHKDAQGDPSYVKEAAAAANVLTAFPNLVGYFADNLQGLVGAARAFKDKKVDMKKVSLVGFDANDELVADLKSGQVDGILLQDPYMMGYGGVWYGVLGAIGIQVPPLLDTGSIVATPATASSPAIQGMLSPLGTPGRNLGL